jgi:phenylalanyl-tRNA synthetase alpha subunit
MYEYNIFSTYRQFNPLKTEFLLNNIHSVRTSQETYYVSSTETNRLMLFRETNTVYGENHMNHSNTLHGQNTAFNYVKAGGTYRNHCALEG